MYLVDAIDKGYIRKRVKEELEERYRDGICSCGEQLHITHDLSRVYCINRGCKETLQEILSEIGVEICIEEIEEVEPKNVYDAICKLWGKNSNVREKVRRVSKAKLLSMGTSMSVIEAEKLLKHDGYKGVFKGVEQKEVLYIIEKMGYGDGELSLAVMYAKDIKEMRRYIIETIGLLARK